MLVFVPFIRDMDVCILQGEYIFKEVLLLILIGDKVKGVTIGNVVGNGEVIVQEGDEG